SLANLNGTVYFAANDGTHGWEPWVDATRQTSGTDGVPNIIEDGAPNGGDGNHDNTPDRLQDNVTSLPDSADGAYVTLQSPDDTDLVGVTATPNPSPADAPAGVAFPIGFLDFTVDGLTLGAPSTVVIYLPSGQNIVSYQKYGFEPVDDPGTPS